MLGDPVHLFAPYVFRVTMSISVVSKRFEKSLNFLWVYKWRKSLPYTSFQSLLYKPFTVEKQVPECLF